MSNDQRQFPRFDYTADDESASADLLVTIPDLSAEPIRPEDFSTGGFRVNVPRRPETGSVHPCTIKVFEITMTDLTSRVARVSESESDPSSWSVGIAIDISDEERDHLASLLVEILGGGSD